MFILYYKYYVELEIWSRVWLAPNLLYNRTTTPNMQSMALKTITIFIDILLFYSVKNKMLWKWQYGPHRALISTSWSLSGITQWDRRIWGSQHPRFVVSSRGCSEQPTSWVSSKTVCDVFWMQRVVTQKIYLVQISLLLINKKNKKINYLYFIFLSIFSLQHLVTAAKKFCTVLYILPKVLFERKR